MAEEQTFDFAEAQTFGDSMVSDPNAKIERNQLEARQGTNRPKVIYVLAASVALIVVGFIVVWLTTTK